jgi:hypothetical protein
LYLANNVVIGGGFGPTVPAGWSLRSAADFNRDGHTDYALLNVVNGQTAIVYLSGRLSVIGVAYGPSLPSGWELVAAKDFNGGGRPDYVLYKPSTGQTLICLFEQQRPCRRSLRSDSSCRLEFGSRR